MNYSGSGKILGMFRKRNLAEAACVLLVFYMFIQSIPFTSGMKILLSITVLLPLVIWFVFGVNDESVTQYIFGWYMYKRNKKNAWIMLKDAEPEKRPEEKKKPEKKKAEKQPKEKNAKTKRKEVKR